MRPVEERLAQWLDRVGQGPEPGLHKGGVAAGVFTMLLTLVCALFLWGTYLACGVSSAQTKALLWAEVMLLPSFVMMICIYHYGMWTKPSLRFVRSVELTTVALGIVLAMGLFIVA